ncbi:hypothetical protein FG379_001535 [Cryptosporidium bovis]|uniref:uncharacterized protein n=1 Tax=Cryptosporidium bovis TaxID=310047 RepID=UPI00351A2406|nr:hypothetical protein FG379_001535 [Cryptosporidium bovis]
MESNTEDHSKCGDNTNPVFTFKDKNILDYNGNEDEFDEELDFKDVNLGKGNHGFRNHSDIKCEVIPKDNIQGADEKKTECKMNCFKRKNIEIIKKNQRVINNKIENTENNILENSVTNLNKNFLLNENGIFDDTDSFYSQLKIAKKRKIQDIKTQFVKYESDSGNISSYKPDINATTQVNYSNFSDNKNLNENLFLSLETEFCRNISNSRNPNLRDFNEKNISTCNNNLDNTNDSNNNSSNNNNFCGNTNNVNDNIETYDVNEPDLSDIHKLNESSGHLNSDNAEYDNILYQKPLDFGLSSTLEFLRSRGDISKKNDAAMTQDNNSGVDSVKEVSIFHTDENGNILDQKSAFKRLCWKFHGQKVNKNKLERIFRNYIRNS